MQSLFPHRLGLNTLFIFLLLTHIASATELHGLISMEDYYSNDSSSAYDLNFLTTRIRLDATKLNKSGTISFHFDGRERNNLGSHDYNSTIKNERIDTLNLDYTGGRIYLAAGRLWPKELPVERVDGINLIYPKTNLGIGFFGGAKPDPYTETFNPDFITMGTYIFYHSEKLSTSLAFTHNGYKGGTDRQYIYGQVSYFPVREFMLYSTVTADIDQLTNHTNLTNSIVELSYRPDYKKSITAGYNQFRAVRLFESMKFDIDSSRQEAYYVSGSYRFLDKYNLYGRVERQSRYYPSIPTDLRFSNSYRLGLSGDDLLHKGINMNLSTTTTDSFNSKNSSYNIELSRLNWEVFQLILNGSYLRSRYELNHYSDGVLTYGASGNLYFSKRWNISFSLDRDQGRDYTTSRLISRVTATF